MRGPLESRPRPPEAMGRKCPIGPRRYRVRVSPTGEIQVEARMETFALSQWLRAIFVFPLRRGAPLLQTFKNILDKGV